MTDAMKKESLSEFTRDQFIDFVERIGRAEAPTEEEGIRWVRHFDRLVEPHPEASDLMFWPKDGIERSSEEIVAEIERYCREHGLPCFKDSPA